MPCSGFIGNFTCHLDFPLSNSKFIHFHASMTCEPQHLVTWKFIMVIELSGVQFGLKSVCVIAREFDLKSQV